MTTAETTKNAENDDLRMTASLRINTAYEAHTQLNRTYRGTSAARIAQAQTDRRRDRTAIIAAPPNPAEYQKRRYISDIVRAAAGSTPARSKKKT